MSTSYDDVSLFSPDGKVKPLEYIKGAVEMGTTAVALKSSNCAVLLAHLGQPGPRSKKIFKISDSVLFCFSGITNDGLTLVEYLLHEDTWQDVYKKRSISAKTVFEGMSVDASLRTMYNRNRMFGAAGILLAMDKEIDLIEWEPTGLYKNVIGVAIGHRSQSARTVLEEVDFQNMRIDELVSVGLDALKNAHPDEELGSENVEIWAVDSNGFREIKL